MEEIKQELFHGIINIDDEDLPSEGDEKFENAAATKNPNLNDDRRLFQVFRPNFYQDTKTQYSELANRLETEGPKPLDFPGNFYDVQGGICLIYWEEDRSKGCLCSIIDVNELDNTFTFNVFSWQGKKKKTYFDTGKNLVANENLVWRLVYRTEFESKCEVDDIRRGQVVRILLKNNVTDFTGYVTNVEGDIITVSHTTGEKVGEFIKIRPADVLSVTEILSSPLWARLCRTVAGEQRGGQNLNQESVQEAKLNDSVPEQVRKPKMLLRSPIDCKYRRAWHFQKIFPKERFEYCTNIALSSQFEEGDFEPFDATAFFPAWFISRRLKIGSKLGYRRDLPWANQTDVGEAFSKLPQDTYEKWHACIRGYLPIDRELYLGSLTGARNRELAVCRIKPEMLRNCRNSREPPLYFVCDEQLAPYFGKMSGAKKRMPKKKIEGLEYFTLATSNKGYDGYKHEIRAAPQEGEKEGELIQAADPVCGGYKFMYIMGGGPRYEVGSTNPSKTFGSMMLLIFMCGGYFRYKNCCVITDSAYGFVEAMLYLSLWGITWVGSLRMHQRRGFLGLKEICQAFKILEQAKKIKNLLRVKGKKYVLRIMYPNRKSGAIARKFLLGRKQTSMQKKEQVGTGVQNQKSSRDFLLSCS